MTPGFSRHLTLTLLLGTLSCTSREVADRPAVGKPAPAYGAISLDGDSVSLAGEQGNVVLLNVWATWCHPCREEIPVLQRMHEAHAGRGLRLIGVSVDAPGAEGDIRRFARQFGMTYPIWLDPDERVAATFLALGVPATYLIDRDGILRWQRIGLIRENDPSLARALEDALTSRTAAR